VGAMRPLRTGSRVVVIVWLLALAASLAPRAALEPAEPVEPEPPRAQVRAVPVEPPAPEPVVPPEPEPAEPSEITAKDLTRGGDLLDSSGRFPMLSASYEGLSSFARYAAAMTGIGGRFVIVSRRAIVGEIDLATGAMRDASLDRPFSPRARDYSDEPALVGPARRVRERFGPDAEIMLLVPRALDAGLFGGIARELAAKGEPHTAYRELEGRYERGVDGGLRFRLVSGVRVDGRREALSAVFDLGSIGGRGSRG